MRLSTLLLAGLGVILTAGSAIAQHRHAHAHVHGSGSLDIAIEGTKVTMELEAPGFDIVGFESAAKTTKQKAAIEKAKAQLAQPLALFVLPAAAGCKAAEEAKVALETGAEQGKDAARGKADAHDHGHSQFRVQYALECAAPASLTRIEFPYFKTFAGAEKLNVNVITSKGQTKFEVTRAKPRIDLAGMM